jgi:hypothetical protein
MHTWTPAPCLQKSCGDSRTRRLLRWRPTGNPEGTNRCPFFKKSAALQVPLFRRLSHDAHGSGTHDAAPGQYGAIEESYSRSVRIQSGSCPSKALSSHATAQVRRVTERGMCANKDKEARRATNRRALWLPGHSLLNGAGSGRCRPPCCRGGASRRRHGMPPGHCSPTRIPGFGRPATSRLPAAPEVQASLRAPSLVREW